MITDFANALTQRLNDYKNRMAYTYFKEFKVEIQNGQKFAKVFRVEIGENDTALNRSIVAFVSLENGDIFKPASFKAPAKHARGNINSPSFGMEAINDSGHVFYLR